MGFKYLHNRSWIDITREERFYCSELYHEAKNQLSIFVELINDSCGLRLPINSEWELGYEVCFYRDLMYYHKLSIRKEKINCSFLTRNRTNKTYSCYPMKRTFDLCLFGKDHIVIIEAKVFQGFDNAQLDEFEGDKLLIQNLLGNQCPKHILLIGLHSSHYSPSQSTLLTFDNHGTFTWGNIAKLYPKNPHFLKADNLRIK